MATAVGENGLCQDKHHWVPLEPFDDYFLQELPVSNGYKQGNMHWPVSPPSYSGPTESPQTFEPFCTLSSTMVGQLEKWTSIYDPSDFCADWIKAFCQADVSWTNRRIDIKLGKNVYCLLVNCFHSSVDWTILWYIYILMYYQIFCDTYWHLWSK
jgi:hypothetical protein